MVIRGWCGTSLFSLSPRKEIGMAYPGLFKELTPEEELETREYARDTDPPNLEHWEIYHPVCREEWMKRGIKPPFEGEGI